MQVFSKDQRYLPSFTSFLMPILFEVSLIKKKVHLPLLMTTSHGSEPNNIAANVAKLQNEIILYIEA